MSSSAKAITVGTHIPSPIWNGFGGTGYFASSWLKITDWMGVPPGPPHAAGQVIWAYPAAAFFACQAFDAAIEDPSASKSPDGPAFGAFFSSQSRTCAR